MTKTEKPEYVTGESSPVETPIEGFDFNSVRLSPSYGIELTTEKVLLSLPVRKPKPGLEFFRIRPGNEWKFATMILDLGEEGEKYIVLPPFVPEAFESGKMKAVTLYFGITYTHNTLFVSDVPLPDELSGKDNGYNRTRREAYATAEKRWLKLKTNKGSEGYDIIVSKGNLPEPVWPQEPRSMNEVLNLAFKDKIINDVNHPVLKNLRGE